MRRTAGLVAVAAVVAAAVPVGAAAGAPTGRTSTVDLTAFRVRLGTHPAFVRAVVDFTDGTLGRTEAEATDPAPLDGHATVVVSHPRVQAQAATVSGHGLTVRVAQGTNRLSISSRRPSAGSSTSPTRR